MSEERKKVEKAEIPKVEPKKRPDPIPELPTEKKTRTKASEDKFVRVSSESKKQDILFINDRILKGEIRWAYYAIDNGIGYHHYLEMK